MNFPESPFLSFLYWLLNTPGIGGIIVGLLALAMLTSIGLTLRWIKRGADVDEAEAYAYPTPALFGEE